MDKEKDDRRIVSQKVKDLGKIKAPKKTKKLNLYNLRNLYIITSRNS